MIPVAVLMILPRDPDQQELPFFFPTFRLDFGITSKGWCQTMISIVLVTAAHIEMDLRTVL